MSGQTFGAYSWMTGTWPAIREHVQKSPWTFGAVRLVIRVEVALNSAIPLWRLQERRHV